MSELICERHIAIKAINTQLTQIEELLQCILSNTPHPDPKSLWTSWQYTTGSVLKNIFMDDSIASSFMVRTSGVIRTQTEILQTEDIAKRFSDAKGVLIGVLSNIEVGLHDSTSTNEINRPTAIVILRRILQNFYKHIEEMYQTRPHGNGTLKKSDLDQIKIGNEYDVQRMLYSIIRPIFPRARLEVPDDTGYRPVRYDIFLDEYDIVVEVKCSRSSMTERDLAEELGADAFHYKCSFLFLFLYDKVKLVKNVDALQSSYKRVHSEDGKDVEAIVIQSVTL